MREAIHLLKYGRKRVLAGRFSDCILHASELVQQLGVYEGVVPIPLHKRRYRQRGFNQAEILAQTVADVLDAPLLSEAVERTRNTAPQSSMTNAAQRSHNLREAFQVIDPPKVEGKRLLLVDDIYTTGATIGEARRTLMEAGALEVNVFTLSRT